MRNFVRFVLAGSATVFLAVGHASWLARADDRVSTTYSMVGQGQRLAVDRKHRTSPRDFKTRSPITNVVVIVMENRTVDNLFASYYGQRYGATGMIWGFPPGPNVANYNGTPTLSPATLERVGDPDHSHLNGFSKEFDNGRNDGWSGEVVHCPHQMKMCTPPSVYSYVPSYETGSYRYIAENFAFGDDVFQANEGPSFVAHQYLIAGQSGGIGTIGAPFAFAENASGTKPGGPDDVVPAPGPTSDPVFDAPNIPDYCSPMTAQRVRTINMTDDYLDELKAEPTTNPRPMPCSDYTTIFDQLATKTDQLSWEYHWAGLAFWAAPAAVKHLASSPNFTSDPGGLNFIKEAKNGTLPTVSYVTPCLVDSDHPNDMQGSGGPNWVATLLNALGSNPSQWSRTAVFITWDDWGGWYDHVPTGHPIQNVYMNGQNPPPNPSDPNEWGFRVPLIAVSPWSKHGFVSHTARSFSSILKFTEWNFGLASLGTDDTYVDNLSDMFDFNQQQPPNWVPIAVPPTYKPCS